MSGRRVTQVVLLLLVAATVAMMFRPKQPDSSAAAPEAGVQPGVSWVAYYFHGDLRCDTCRSIEAQAAAAIQSGFAAELADGTLQWQVLNTDRPENAHFIADFALTHSTVVLVERESGQLRRFATLDRIWELHSEAAAFSDYVQSEVGAWVRAGA